jgi:hypothetical protein
VIGRGVEPGLCALSLVIAVVACGDVKDVQVPLIPSRRTERAVPELPTFEFVGPAQAVASVEVGGGDSGACPFEYSSLLPRSLERSALLTGVGDRLVDGPDALVECRVHSPYGSPGVFDVDAHVALDGMPRFVVTGVMSEPGPNVVGLVLVTPDQDRIAADCSSDPVSLLPGAAWFRLSSCVVRRGDGEPLECDVAVTAIFENCSP